LKEETEDKFLRLFSGAAIPIFLAAFAPRVGELKP
jgi:hypothetical protein